MDEVAGITHLGHGDNLLYLASKSRRTRIEIDMLDRWDAEVMAAGVGLLLWLLRPLLWGKRRVVDTDNGHSGRNHSYSRRAMVDAEDCVLDRKEVE